MTRVSQKLKVALKCAEIQEYRIAIAAGVNPTTLSKLMNGAQPVKPFDERVISVGAVLGLNPDECFESAEVAAK